MTPQRPGPAAGAGAAPSPGVGDIDSRRRPPARAQGSAAAAPGSVHRAALWVPVLVVLLLAAVAASLMLGARAVAPAVVWQSLTHADPTNPDHLTILVGRVPRTVLGLLCGAGLGVGGAVMQGLTRNPVADPGLLGVGAGASLAVVVSISYVGVASVGGYVWAALAGAAVAAVLVVGVAARGAAGASPATLALAGAAVNAGISGLIAAILLTSYVALDQVRFWQVGALAGRGWDVVGVVTPFIAAGVVLAVALGRSLSALALGDDVATSLGSPVRRVRALGLGAVVLTCGAATAAAGPISFVGLAVPHVARWVAGIEYRSIVVASALLGPVMLLGCDVAGRLIGAPGEVQVGIVTAVVGAITLIALARRGKLVRL